MEGATIPEPGSNNSAGLDQTDVEAGLPNTSTSSEQNQFDFRTMLADQQPSQENLVGSDHAKAGNDDGSAATEKRNPAQVPNATTGNDSSGNINTSTRSSQSLTVKDSSKSNSSKKSTKASLQNKFMHLREHNDKKVVGLKNYGVSQSTRDVRKNEWLSSTRSMQSHPELTANAKKNNDNTTSNQVVELRDISPPIPGVMPSTADNPGMYMYSGDGGGEGPPGQAPLDHTKHLLVEDVAAPAAFLRPPKMPKSVEELEEKARRKAVLNPFELLFLGNLAALKVMGFYLITLETIISCGLVSFMKSVIHQTKKLYVEILTRTFPS